VIGTVQSAREKAHVIAHAVNGASPPVYTAPGI
jgi:hypothetical protein